MTRMLSMMRLDDQDLQSPPLACTLPLRTWIFNFMYVLEYCWICNYFCQQNGKYISTTSHAMLFSMASKLPMVLVLLFHVLLAFKPEPSEAQTWIKVGCWYSGSGSPVSDINSALFTHLLYAYAAANSSSYELYVSSSARSYYSTFTETVKKKNPSITTLLSIGGGDANYSVFSTLVSNTSHRNSFIQSSIKLARLNGFQGLDLCWLSANTRSDMSNLALLFQEWRVAVNSEATTNQLILTASVLYAPGSFPIDSIRNNLDWVHVISYNYYMPQWSNFTGAYAALYDPSSFANTDDGIKAWIGSGLPASKLVLGLPFYGYAWTLVNPSKDNSIGAPTIGPAITKGGAMSYKDINGYIQKYGAGSDVVYNATYVAKYCVIGSIWIGFDDAEIVRLKVSYAKEKGLRGYFVWQVSQDDNWSLSLAAEKEEESDQENRQQLLLIILLPLSLIIMLIALGVCYLKRNLLKTNRTLDNDSPHLQVFSFSNIQVATNNFSSENKLGEGGFGPVYKGKLKGGQKMAVKRLSKTSTQGHQEFSNEVTLTAKLQHVNLVRVLGYCIDKEEKMLIYEYMPNKSLDFYLFDPSRRYFLDWSKRVHIIEGVTQGLLYLQEYSNFTIIHRDLKASNILLDHEMNAKISDFGMAKLFGKDEFEANTSRIVGTYGYVPPEYVRNGIYSMKYDVYSFGVFLLQIISGRRNSSFYGPNESLHLLEYAYESWKEGKGMEFMDPSLDDSSSSCKLLRCLQIALLCVQENPEDRPTMLEVYSMLKRDTEAIAIPGKTAFSGKRDENVENVASEQGSCSVNTVSTSELLPR